MQFGKRRKLVPEMEGAVARWYARVRGTERQLAEYRKQATTLTAGLADGAEILEVAPGPGYLAIELARSGRFRVTGLDISRTFVEIASERAHRERVNVGFRQGDVSQTCRIRSEGIGMEIRLTKTSDNGTGDPDDRPTDAEPSSG